MTTSEEGATVYTIGHSNLPVDDLVARLRQHGITMVVDVRSVPFSHYTPQFNRDALERSMSDAGIGYAFAGDYLGGRPTDPTCYHNRVVPDGEANYLELVNYEEVARRPWYRRGLDRLFEIASERPTAVMCSEEDPSRCHRHRLIAQRLLAQAIAVQHIRKDGSIEPAEVEPKQLSLLP